MEKIKCIKFPKIEQFRNIVSTLIRQSTFVELDEHGDAVYDSTKVKPTLMFKGSVKLHGTNAGVSYNDKFGLWAQSRNTAFTLDKHDSCMGFTFFVNSHRELFESFMRDLSERNNIDTSKFCITIFGEWAGKGVQKRVSISEIDKSFFVFGVKVSNPDDIDFNSYWLDHSEIRSNENKVFNILDFQTFEIEIDFNFPKLVQDKLSTITENVEQECPVAKALGHSGIGEGVVWICDYKGTRHTFKVKGKEHSVSNTSDETLAPVDVEKLNSIQEFVNYSVTRARVEQGLGEVFNSSEEYDRKRTGAFLKWITNDIMSEEMDVLLENDLTPKDVNKYVSTKAREMFFKEIDDSI
tara:strand:- start:88947 stop:90002 length:1056 start_codon:yes stop_codon:yes gene_type:complete